MKLIARKFEHAGKYDRLVVVRTDGSETACDIPRQGILPHDLVHAVVESGLLMSDGFLGLVGKGADIVFTAKNFHDYIDPVKHFEAAQAESVVEGLQTQLWAGEFDYELFILGVSGACAMRGVAAPLISNSSGRAMFDEAVHLNLQWGLIAPHGEFVLPFPLNVREAV